MDDADPHGRLAWLRELVKAEEGDDVGDPPDRIAAAAAAIAKQYGWWDDPVLSPEVILEMAELVAGVVASSPVDHEEDDEFFEHARREMFPKMRDSQFVVTLFSAEPDPKLCMELGAALLFDKPILGVTIGDRFDMPVGLRRLLTDTVRIEEDESIGSGPGADRLADAIQRMVRPDP